MAQAPSPNVFQSLLGTTGGNITNPTTSSGLGLAQASIGAGGSTGLIESLRSDTPANRLFRGAQILQGRADPGAAFQDRLLKRGLQTLQIEAAQLAIRKAKGAELKRRLVDLTSITDDDERDVAIEALQQQFPSFPVKKLADKREKLELVLSGALENTFEPNTAKGIVQALLNDDLDASTLNAMIKSINAAKQRKQTQGILEGAGIIEPSKTPSKGGGIAGTTAQRGTAAAPRPSGTGLEVTGITTGGTEGTKVKLGRPERARPLEVIAASLGFKSPADALRTPEDAIALRDEMLRYEKLKKETVINLPNRPDPNIITAFATMRTSALKIKRALEKFDPAFVGLLGKVKGLSTKWSDLPGIPAFADRQRYITGLMDLTNEVKKDLLGATRSMPELKDVAPILPDNPQDKSTIEFIVALETFTQTLIDKMVVLPDTYATFYNLKTLDFTDELIGLRDGLTRLKAFTLTQDEQIAELIRLRAKKAAAQAAVP